MIKYVLNEPFAPVGLAKELADELTSYLADALSAASAHAQFSGELEAYGLVVKLKYGLGDPMYIEILQKVEWGDLAKQLCYVAMVSGGDLTVNPQVAICRLWIRKGVVSETANQPQAIQ